MALRERGIASLRFDQRGTGEAYALVSSEEGLRFDDQSMTPAPRCGSSRRPALLLGDGRGHGPGGPRRQPAPSTTRSGPRRATSRSRARRTGSGHSRPLRFRQERGWKRPRRNCRPRRGAKGRGKGDHVGPEIREGLSESEPLFRRLLQAERPGLPLLALRARHSRRLRFPGSRRSSSSPAAATCKSRLPKPSSSQPRSSAPHIASCRG